MSNNIYSYSDEALCEELFERLERIRLERNVSQKALAEEVGITPVTYRNIRTGNAKWITLVAVLRALGKLDNLNSFLPNEPVSPIDLAKQQGKQRQRARGGLSGTSNPTDSTSPNSELDW